MKRYTKYKDSGVEWIGEVPEHWRILRIKFLFQNIIGGVWGEDAQNDDNDVFCIRVADFDFANGIVSNHNLTIRNIKPNEQKQRLLRKGDLLLEKSGGGEKSPVGRMIQYTLDYPAVCSNFINRLVPQKEYNSYFLTYYFKAAYSRGLSARFINQTTGIQNLNNEAFLSQQIFIPEISEQNQIARYLNEKTNQISTIIAKKLQLINFLKEERAALITQAVIQGLNPDVKMKDSGIAWLGEVPEHWRIGKLKWYARTTSGGTPNTIYYQEYYNGHIPWVRTLDLNGGPIYDTELKITDKALKDTACKVFPSNTVMVAMYGGEGTIGKNGILEIAAATNQAICAILPSSAFYPKYLHNFLKFYRPYWMIGAEGTRRDPNISQEDIKNAYFSLPPFSEQIEIAEYIKTQTTRINSTISQLEREISLLEEYRTALISEVVTGKVCVLGEA